MKTTRLFFIALVLYFIGNAAFAQTVGKTYDYITIVASTKIIYVSYNGEKYEKIKDSDKSQGDYDFNLAISSVKKYEKDGYELFTNNFAFLGINEFSYFLLRREHKE